MAGSDDSTRIAVEAGQKVVDGIRSFLMPNGTGTWGAKAVSNAFGAFVSALTSFVMGFFGAVFRVSSELAALFLTGIAATRTDNQDAINQVTASALSEVLGVDVSSSDLPSGGGAAAQLELFRALGGKVLDMFTRELGGQANSTPGPGETAARGFLGIGINFAVSASLLAIISEIESLGFIKGFKEIGEELRGALGLGRLTRLALQPLLHATVTQPYTQETNRLYRPHQLGVPEYVKAVESGRMQEADFNDALARLGYSDTLIAELRTQHLPRLPARDVDALIRWGKVDQATGLALLVSQGMSQGQAQLELDSLHLAQADAQERAHAGELLRLAQNREIDSATFETLLRNLHLSDEEHQGYLNRLGAWLESHFKPLQLSELLYLAERNLITGDEITAWAEREGYSPNDIATLELWVTQKELDYDALQKAKAAKAAAAAAKKAAKGSPPAKG